MNSRISILIALIALGIVLFGCVQQPPQQACTEEAKICPDGSSVGRIPPACEFAPCPSTGTATGQAVATDLDQDMKAFDGSVSGLNDEVPSEDFPTDASEYQ